MDRLEYLQQSRRRFDAILYDLDGTLVETAPDLCAALNHCLNLAGRPPVALERVRDLVGDGARALLRRGLEKEHDDIEVDELFPKFLKYYGDHVADQSRPFPGVMSFLADSEICGFKQAVCTNKPEALSRALLTQLEMAEYFPVVVGGDSLSVRKPDPKHIAETARRLAIDLDRCVMIGDSANDVNSARAAGLPVIAVSFGYHGGALENLRADQLVDHFDDIPTALAHLAATSGPKKG